MSEREKFESTDVTRLHISEWVKALPLAGVITQIPRLLGGSVLGAEYAGIATIVSIGLMFAVIVLGLRRLNQRRAETGTLRVDADGIHWNNGLVAPRTKIVDGVIMPGVQIKDRRIGARVRVMRRRAGAIEFGVKDESEGRAMLRALGLDSSQTTATFRARSRMASNATLLTTIAVIMGMSMAFGATRGSGGLLVAMLMPLLVLAAIIPASVPTTVVVGTDGILFKWMGTRRYVSYQDITGVAPTETGVVYSTRDGRTLHVEFGVKLASKSSRERARIERDTFVARVEQARTAAPTVATQVDPDAVSCGERDVASWLKALRALTEGEGGMRTAPVLRDQLFGLVDDTRADPSARAGAAAALGLNAAPPERERLRAVAATIAAPRLRVVVEAAADGDEKKLIDALDEVRDASRTRVAG